MNKELLMDYIEKYKECIQTDEKVQKEFEKREDKLRYFQSFDYEKIINLSREELGKYLIKLWNVSYQQTNAIIDNNGEDNLKNRLADLLFGFRPFEMRFNEFYNNISIFRAKAMSEVLSCTYPNDYLIWNKKVKTIFGLLGINDITLKQEEIDAETYKEIIKQGKIIQNILNESMNENYNLYETDFFYEIIYTRYLEKEEPSSLNYFMVCTNRDDFSFLDKSDGYVQEFEYKTKSEAFNKAEPGDEVICYEARPTKKIVSICEIEKNDVENKKLYIKKIKNVNEEVPFSTISSTEKLEKIKTYITCRTTLFEITEEERNIIMEKLNEINSYKKEFLSKVYMSEKKYNAIIHLLEQNKNIIIKGSPGVGKTFMAKELAYSIIGYKAEDQIEFVQFHQSYSYEDFVEGYKPCESDGSKFELRPGLFLKFRNNAVKSEDKKYVLIIDEINRGNLSKIFGELLMLIEADKRKEKNKEAKYKIKLASGRTEDFYIPDNLYIIGLMNTADRSLEMIDYALRRRFAFISVLPAFSKEDEEDELEESKVFYEYVNKAGNEEIKRAVKEMKELNKDIKEKLGEDFMIGHSYFCGLDKPTREDILEIYEYKILPLLEEYFYDNKDIYKDYKKELLGNKNHD